MGLAAITMSHTSMAVESIRFNAETAETQSFSSLIAQSGIMSSPAWPNTSSSTERVAKPMIHEDAVVAESSRGTRKRGIAFTGP